MDKPIARFSRRAQRDLAHILAWTERNWSAELADETAETIVQTLAHIQQHPEIGRSRPAITPGCRSFPTDVHMIYYLLLEDSIYIMRILHQRQDTVGQFDDLD